MELIIRVKFPLLMISLIFVCAYPLASIADTDPDSKFKKILALQLARLNALEKTCSELTTKVDTIEKGVGEINTQVDQNKKDIAKAAEGVSDNQSAISTALGKECYLHPFKSDNSKCPFGGVPTSWVAKYPAGNFKAYIAGKSGPDANGEFHAGWVALCCK